MPIYEIECPKCKDTKEIICLYEEYIRLLAMCNTCEVPMHKILSSGNFVLKGEGFYKRSLGEITNGST